MTTMPVCSATTSCCSFHSQICLHGGSRPLSLHRKASDFRCVLEAREILGLSSGNHLQAFSLRAEAATSFCSNSIDGGEQSGFMGFTTTTPCPNKLADVKYEFINASSNSTGGMNVPYYVEMGNQEIVASSTASAGDQELMGFTDQLTENTNILPEPVGPQTTTTDVIPDDPAALSDSLAMDNASLSTVKTNIEEVFSGINGSINSSVSKGESALRNSIGGVTSSLEAALSSAKDAVDKIVGKVNSSVDQMGELTANKLTGFSTNLKESSSKVGMVIVDVLRHAIVQIENSLNQGITNCIYAYGSAKNLLPPDAQNVLNLTEERVIKILSPVGTAFQQIYIVLEGLEKNIGLDPSDPVVPFVLFIGTSATLWGSFWLFTYGGYAGDLSPKSTLELLRGKENAVLIDVRPEFLRERDGIPDFRRAARFRYQSITLPEVNSSLRNLVKSGKDLEDLLIAAVIRNLKIIQDRSKVIVMDADGSCSKGIARSLRKLGVKQPYLVQGGFRSWANECLRIKKLKPETALTILNEEAEAILEDIKPTPVKVLGYGVGSVAALYAILEWETTLQLIGIIGLGQTIYRRIASYEDAGDFKKDVRLLLAPVRLGGRAISWAAGKLETNGIRLPTSPSSSDVQNRVLQAAAKHESQPSDGEEDQDLTSQLPASVGESMDVSEA
ncbi:uncharacterized protein LOC127810814 [Diospyros lotus]|uniref:uncharacterized protein LOC127810814 n=1 Tax=Diospyros lotus TaxID=55363 RepID=UPI0022560F87|nr:uncharacterized protein LOC127810814 [Diospyros lotus]